MSMFFQEALLYDPKSKMFQMASEPDEFRSGFFQRHWPNKIPKFQLLHQKNCLQIDLNLQRIPEIKKIFWLPIHAKGSHIIAIMW